ncbi:MAG: ABC transporter ATP-binding protein [Flavobacteriales bacterium]|nr:ABC transporter ATP-binding protein [Flavobacteriales bacterium]
MSTTAEHNLRVEELTIGFRSHDEIIPAVTKISFTVKPRETLALVGESGSGKSVSSLALMGLLPDKVAVIQHGEIHFADMDVLKHHNKNAEKKNLRGGHLAMIFQEPMTALNPVMRCGKQVAEMLRKHNKFSAQDAMRRTIELFDEVHIPEPKKAFLKYPWQMSGGQRQRVMIAMAVSCEPFVLIADEITTALDVTVQKSILELLKSLQQKHGMAIIFITHDLGVVREIADRIIVMRKGEIVEQGTRDEIFSNPQHPYTKGLMACRPQLGEKKERLLTIDDFEKSKQYAAPLPDGQEGSRPLPPDNNRVAVTFPTAIGRQSEKYSPGEVILKVNHLSKIYRQTSGFFTKEISETRAVDDISFDVFRGETLGLVGESGCGKTTLSRMLLGLIPPTSGEIIFGGKNISSLAKSEMRKLRKDIQIIFQDPYSSLNPRIQIGEALCEPMRVFGLHDSEKKRQEKARMLLHRVGLSQETMDRFPHEFSGGQRQRIVIARALALEPKFIVCDESVSALDASIQAQVLNLLNDLKKEMGLTYIFISHDLSVVHHMSDRIMVMNKGRIEELGTPEEIFIQPQTAYTKKLLESVPGGNL